MIKWPPRWRKRTDYFGGGRGGAASALKRPASPSLVQDRKKKAKVASAGITYKDVDTSFYAQYGITSGTTNFLALTATKMLSCAILSQGWPSWYWAASARGYVIKLVILSNPSWKAVILKQPPSTTVLVWSADLEIPREQLDMIFSDFDLGGVVVVCYSSSDFTEGYTRTARRMARCKGFHFSSRSGRSD
jgi:hypothetical protein